MQDIDLEELEGLPPIPRIKERFVVNRRPVSRDARTRIRKGTENSFKRRQLSKKQRFTRHKIGERIEDRFEHLMKSIIESGIAPQFLDCKRAPKNEDYRHKTDFKVRAQHPGGYEFYIRIQVKGSRNYLFRLERKPLPPDVVLVIMDRGSNIFSLMSYLSNVHREKVKVEQERV